MKTFKRVLIGMDGTEMDLRLLDYLKVLHPKEKPNKVYCTHVVKELDLPSFFMDKEGAFEIEPQDESLRKKLEDVIKKKLRLGLYDVDCEVIEGKITEQLMHWSEVKGVDLAILGKKNPALGSGISAKRFLRRSSSSVLFVPDKSKYKFKKIALATDFSKNSTYALLKILDWAKKFPGKVNISLIHIFDIPPGLQSQLGNYPDEMIRRIRNTTREFVDYYLEEIQVPKEDLEICLMENFYANPGDLIYRQAKEIDADLLVMGAQGHSMIKNLLLGSVSEKVLDLNMDIPFLVLRPKPMQLENIKAYSINRFKKLEPSK